MRVCECVCVCRYRQIVVQVVLIVDNLRQKKKICTTAPYCRQPAPKKCLSTPGRIQPQLYPVPGVARYYTKGTLLFYTHPYTLSQHTGMLLYKWNTVITSITTQREHSYYFYCCPKRTLLLLHTPGLAAALVSSAASVARILGSAVADSYVCICIVCVCVCVCVCVRVFYKHTHTHTHTHTTYI